MAENIPLDVARERVLGSVRSERVPLTVPLERALGHRLFEPLRAAGPWPATDRAAMDGFALRAGAAGLPAGTRLPVVGSSLAGHPFPGEVPAGAAVQIMTGAVVPPGTDTVVPVEETEGFAGATVVLRAGAVAGKHIRRRGSEIAAGELLVAAGTRLRSAEIGALAVLGCDPVRVVTPPRVAVLATGDEVVPIRAEPADHQVRNSNSAALAAQVRESGGQPLDLGIAGDATADLRPALQRGLVDADVLLTIGGVSKGTHDLVHGTLCELGVEPLFHGIELKPGKPTFFGVLDREGKRRYVFGLPGNPASCYTVFDLLVRPLLEAWLGALGRPPVAVLYAGAPQQRNPRQQAVPARLEATPGGLAAVAARVRPSGDPFALLGADGYVLLPPGQDPSSLRTLDFVPYADGALR